MLLFYFLIDTACVNAYLLWKWSSAAHTAAAEQTHNSHKDFMNALCTQLLHFKDPIGEKQQEKQQKQQEEQQKQQEEHINELSHLHKQVYGEARGRCEWGRLNAPGCPRKNNRKRKFGDDITESATNGASKAILHVAFTHYECSECQIRLCIQGPCWQQYHHSIGLYC